MDAADAAQTSLVQKCNKAYVMPTYLVLDARSAGIETADSWTRMVDRIRMPVGCQLLAAFVCFSENGTGTPRFLEIART